MKWCFQESSIENKLDFNKDIFGCQLFFLIKQDFVRIIKKFIPKKIIEHKKNKERVLDNLFCHWFFWEAYTSPFTNYHPLLLEGKFNYKSLRNILSDYFRNAKRDLNFDEIKTELKLEEKFKKAINLLKKNSDINCWYNILKNSNTIKIHTGIDTIFINVCPKLTKKLLHKISEETFVRLMLRYYVLGSNNNQLATNSKKIKEINPDLELFSSGFNNTCNNFCSMFPDLERDLGSLGRFQDIELTEGVYEINPPFQTTMIYDILRKIKRWIKMANESDKNLEFHLFLPNWFSNNNKLEYSKYEVLSLAEEIDGKVTVNNLKNTSFDYIDYLNDKVRNYTLPDTLYLIIKN